MHAEPSTGAVRCMTTCCKGAGRHSSCMWGLAQQVRCGAMGWLLIPGASHSGLLVCCWVSSCHRLVLRTGHGWAHDICCDLLHTTLLLLLWVVLVLLQEVAVISSTLSCCGISHVVAVLSLVCLGG